MRKFATNNQRRLGAWLEDNDAMDLGEPHRDRILKAPSSFPDIEVYGAIKGVARGGECKVFWYRKGKPTPNNSPYEMNFPGSGKGNVRPFEDEDSGRGVFYVNLTDTSKQPLAKGTAIGGHGLRGLKLRLFERVDLCEPCVDLKSHEKTNCGVCMASGDDEVICCKKG